VHILFLGMIVVTVFSLGPEFDSRLAHFSLRFKEGTILVLLGEIGRIYSYLNFDSHSTHKFFFSLAEYHT